MAGSNPGKDGESHGSTEEIQRREVRVHGGLDRSVVGEVESDPGLTSRGGSRKNVCPVV